MEEKSKYDYIYTHPNLYKTYGKSTHGRRAIPFLSKWDADSLVDIGCGHNLFKKEFIDSTSCKSVVGVDFSCESADVISDAQELPFVDKQFDVLTSFDMLEHLLPETVDTVLSEMARISRRFCLSISYVKSITKVKGQPLHPTVRTKGWWKSRLMRAGAIKIREHGGYICGEWADKLPIDKGDSVIVVGNGPSIIQKKNGELIDSFDHVIRFNDYKTDGFEGYTGSKTSFWTTHFLQKNPMLMHDRTICTEESRDPIEGVTENFKIPKDYHKALHVRLRDYIWRKSGFTNEADCIRPSSGFVIINYLLEVLRVEQIHIVGFDHFSKDESSAHHYWMMKSFGKPREHDGDAERALLADLVLSGRINYLSKGSFTTKLPSPEKEVKVVEREVPPPKPLFPECIWDRDVKIHCDRQIAIVAYSRSGSHCITDWICSQFNGHIRYSPGMNLTERRRNNPDLFIDGDNRLPSSDTTRTEGKKTYVASLERYDPTGEIVVPWIGSESTISIIILRNPFNWLASLNAHGNGRFKSTGPPTLLRAWAKYAEAALNRDDCVPIYYDTFISSKSYRDSIADRIGVDVRSDDSLSRVSEFGRGSSFDGMEFDGRAGEMKTTERWEIYKDEIWMIDAMNDKKIQHLLGEIESFVLT